MRLVGYLSSLIIQHIVTLRKSQAAQAQAVSDDHLA